MIRLTETNGHVSVVLECDYCGGEIKSAVDGVVLQRMGGESWHVHQGKCCHKTERSMGWIRARASLESFIESLASLSDTNQLQPHDDTPAELPPAKVCEQLMAMAWADHTPDDQRLLLEQAAVAVQHLMRRCVHLAQAVERAEAA